MTILDKIAADKRKEIQMKKEVLPVEVLEGFPHFSRKCFSLTKSLKENNSGIITEFKRKSPSSPDINLNANVEGIAMAYENAGAAGISILTDEIYFGGLLDDIILARNLTDLPILRKDFMIDEYQILEAKAIGADVILLIASLLSKKEVAQFSKTAKELGMEVLLELHNEEELQKSLMSSLDLIGVNNRNLKTFEVDLNTSKTLAEKIPKDFMKISESGIGSIDAIQDLKNYGFQGFLMGEHFMKTGDPGKNAAEFIGKLR